MVKISLCMIVKDEQDVIERCLKSVAKAVDEIIIVDTGSSDDTKKIARLYTEKIFDFVWTDDFSAARNFSFSHAHHPYLMWLDADDVVTEENVKKLLSLKDQLDISPADVVYMPYEIAFDENSKSVFTYYRERIVKKSANPVWIEPVHEVISVSGKSIYSDVAVQHRKIKTNASGRNLKIIQKQLDSGNKLSARLSYYYARELMFNDRLDESIAAFENFLTRKDAWSENCISACEDLSSCYEQRGDNPNAFKAAFAAFYYSPPRAKTMCRIAELFLKQDRLQEAEYWYLSALSTPLPTYSLGFVEADYHGYIPAVSLCVVYDKLGRKDDAEKYNEIAGSFKPNSPAYLYNKKYFNTLKRG